MIGVGGLVSGLDTNSMVAQLVGAARTPITQLRTQLGAEVARRDALQQLNTLLAGLRDAAQAVDTAAEFTAATASSSQPSSVAVRALPGAAPAAFSVEVVSLARGSVLLADSGFAAGETLAGGTLTVTVGATVTEVEISSAAGTDTPQGLAAWLGANVPGVDAFVLDTGAGAQPLRLVVKGSDTGAAAAVSLSATQGGAGAALSFTTQQTAADAVLNVEGIAVVAPSNTVDGLVPGVGLDLLAASTGSVSVAVARDEQGIAAGVRSVVEAWNALADFVRGQTGTSVGGGGPLSGDPTLRAVQRRLADVFSATEGQGSLTGPRAAGVTLARDGRAVLDEAALSAAIAADWDGVVSMLGSAEGLFGQLGEAASVIADPETGLLQPRLDASGARQEAMQARIDTLEARITRYEASLRDRFTAMELALARYRATGDMLTQQIAQMNKSR